MPAQSWFEDEDAWDSIEIADFVFENLPVDVDVELVNEWDEKKAAGNDGAPATNKGYSVCKPKVSFVIYNDELYELYQELVSVIQPKPGKQAPPIVDIVHPQLMIFGKSKFNVAKIRGLKKVGPQMMEAQIEFIEYFPAPKPAPKPVVKATEPPERVYAIFDPLFDAPSKDAGPGEEDSDVAGGISDDFGEG